MWCYDNLWMVGEATALNLTSTAVFLRLLPRGPPVRDKRTACLTSTKAVVGSILEWWAMCSDSDESRQLNLDFAGPVGPLRDEGPTVKWAQHGGAGTNMWASKLAARFGSFCDCLNGNGWG